MDFDKPVPMAVAVPFPAGVLMLQVSGSPSGSVASRVRSKAVGEPSSDMVTSTEVPSVMTGGSLTWLIVTFTVMRSRSKPSSTLTIKLSVPK